MVRRHTQPPLPPSPPPPTPQLPTLDFNSSEPRTWFSWSGMGFVCCLYWTVSYSFERKTSLDWPSKRPQTLTACICREDLQKGRGHEAAMWLQTGQGAGWACSLFLVDKTQELVLVSPEWILKDNLHGAGWGWNCCFGCLLTPAVLPLCYLLALDCLAVPWPHLCKSLSSLALLMSPTDGL